MTVPQSRQVRLAQQIKVCEDVIEQLTQLDSRELTGLIDDVQRLRASFMDRLASMDGDGSRPAA